MYGSLRRAHRLRRKKIPSRPLLQRASAKRKGPSTSLNAFFTAFRDNLFRCASAFSRAVFAPQCGQLTRPFTVVAGRSLGRLSQARLHFAVDRDENFLAVSS